MAPAVRRGASASPRSDAHPGERNGIDGEPRFAVPTFDDEQSGGPFRALRGNGPALHAACAEGEDAHRPEGCRVR